MCLTVHKHTRYAGTGYIGHCYIAKIFTEMYEAVYISACVFESAVEK